MRNTQAWCTHVRLGYKVSILRPGARARGVRVVKLAGQDRYLARSRTYEPGSYFELWVSPWGHVRCTCPGGVPTEESASTLRH